MSNKNPVLNDMKMPEMAEKGTLEEAFQQKFGRKSGKTLAEAIKMSIRAQLAGHEKLYHNEPSEGDKAIGFVE